jgi:hypothetical protein
MKTMNYFAALLVLGTVILVGQVNAQNVGIAADKQKQENLEKNKKRQAELKKKYNSMTPEQAADAKKRANEYKKNGGKTTSPKTQPAVSGSKTITPVGVKKTTTQAPASKPKTKQPVWMDPKGHAKPATPPPATNVKPEAKPATGTKVTPSTKPTQKQAVAPGKK